MLDLSYIGNNSLNVQTFTAAGTWVTWNKPRGAKFVNILCIGAGGGGGGGLIAAAGNHGGGAGGTGAAFVRANFSAGVLPDSLYIYTGIGGAGGNGGAVPTAGTSGGLSYVAFDTIFTASALLCVSGQTVNIGGFVGSTANTATPAGSSATVVANSIFLNLGNFIASAGVNGSIGAATSTGGNISVGNIVTGGGGGSGGNAGSVSIIGAGPIPTIAGATGATANGNNGIMITKPILAFTGGTAGGSNSAGAPGISGNGSWGCGGAGGSGGTSGTGGNGGRGGDGIVIITTIV